MKKNTDTVSNIIDTAGKASNLLKLYSVMKIITVASAVTFAAATVIKAFRS